MKLFLQTTTLLLLFTGLFGQEATNIEVRSVEYVWVRQPGDYRMVMMMDSINQEIFKRSLIKAIRDKWKVEVPAFTVKVNKLSALRMQPKFNTQVSNADTTKWYLFLQLFDESVTINPNYSLLSSRIIARYRLIKGTGGNAEEDRTASFAIMKRDAPLGQIRLNRFSIYPPQFQYACDSIINSIINGVTRDDYEIWLDAACAYADSSEQVNSITDEFHFGDRRESISLIGEHGFTMAHDSVNVTQTGKKKHGGSNTALGLLTLFSNIDTEKKRSILLSADHSFSEGPDNYHCFINYIETKVAERRRVKDEEGYKSVEVSDYQPGGKEINPGAMHTVTLNGDTIASFTIQSRFEEEHFTKMWNGRDTSTVDSLPASLNNPAKMEVEMKGTVSGAPFLLTTSDAGRIKHLTINDEQAFTLYSNTDPAGKIIHRGLDTRQIKLATLLCLLSDKILTLL